MGNDVIAQGVIYAAQSLGLNVPADISVTGIGDFSGSTIRVRLNDIKYLARRPWVDLANQCVPY